MSEAVKAVLPGPPSHSYRSIRLMVGPLICTQQMWVRFLHGAKVDHELR